MAAEGRCELILGSHSVGRMDVHFSAPMVLYKSQMLLYR